MKLVSYRDSGQTAAGALIENQVYRFPSLEELDVNSGSRPFCDLTSYLNAGPSVLKHAIDLLLETVSHGGPPGTPLANLRLCAPLSKPGKIVAVGLNYRDHAEEARMEPGKTPVIFAKFPSSITGPYDNILLPAGDAQVDFEAELAFVIGRTAKDVSETEAMNFVAGYLCLNDVSARKWQFSDQQWVRGKSCDTFCPIGPFLTTPEDIQDPHQLRIRSRLNGVTMQDSNTNNLIFTIPSLVAFISASITLHPGDIITTGTPAGVGSFRTPPVFLAPGDTVEVEIERLGSIKNRVVARPGKA